MENITKITYRVFVSIQRMCKELVWVRILFAALWITTRVKVKDNLLSIKRGHLRVISLFFLYKPKFFSKTGPEPNFPSIPGFIFHEPTKGQLNVDDCRGLSFIVQLNFYPLTSKPSYPVIRSPCY